MKYIKRILTFLICGLIIFGAIYSNSLYALSKEKNANLYDDVDMEGIIYKVIDVSELSKEQSDVYYKETRDTLGDSITYLIKVNIKNDSGNQKKLSLGGFAIARDDYANFPDFEVFLDVNKADVNLTLMIGEEKQIILPYTIHQINFTDKQWEDIRSSKFQLVLALYPSKVAINLY